MQQDVYPRANLFLKAWYQIRHFFSSIKLAVVLMFVLVSLGLIGTFLIQAPQSFTGDPTVYAQWVESVARPLFGGWTTLLNALGLFDVFHSIWFLGSGFLLVINIFVCSLNRLIRSLKTVRSDRIIQADAFYDAGADSLELHSSTSNMSASTELLKATLKKRGYSAKTAFSNGNIYLNADKNRLMQFGTYFSHLSIILLITGFIVSSSGGFRNNNFEVPEGKTVDVGYNTGLSFHLNSFSDTYWEDGTPKDYASDVILYENGSPVKQGLVKVNHPMDYHGVRFFQSFFGPAISLRVTDNNSKTIYDDSVPLDSMSTGVDISRPAGILSLQGIGLLVYIVAPGNGGQDTLIGQNQLDLEIFGNGGLDTPVASELLDLNNSKSLAGYQFTYLGSSRFSGFQVSKDPGVNIIWIAAGMFVASICLVLYFPRRRAWAKVSEPQDDESIMRLRFESKRFVDLAGESEEIVKDIKARL